MCDQSAFGHPNHKSRRPVTCGFLSSDVCPRGDLNTRRGGTKR